MIFVIKFNHIKIMMIIIINEKDKYIQNELELKLLLEITCDLIL